MKNTLKKIAVMQAFCEGKPIQMYYNSINKWEDYISGEPLWDWRNQNYRIKQEPEYQPFDFNDAESLIGNIIRHKATKSLSVITNVNPKNVTSSGTVIHYDILLNKYEYTDGSICGKLKQ